MLRHRRGHEPAVMCSVQAWLKQAGQRPRPPPSVHPRMSGHQGTSPSEKSIVANRTMEAPHGLRRPLALGAAVVPSRPCQWQACRKVE